MSPYSKYVALFMPLFLLLGACTDKDADIPTKNRVVLYGDNQGNLRTSDAKIELPDAILNTDWTQISGLPFNDIGNLQAIDDFSKVKKVYIGETKDDDDEVTMQPVFSAGSGFFFTVDSELIALDLETHKILWQKKIMPVNDIDVTPRGGGLVSDGGYVFITTNSGIVAAYDSKTGNQMWRLNNKVPFSAAPTLSAAVLYVIDRDNRLQAIDANTGQVLWDYRGLPEAAAYSRVAAASVFGAVLIAPFTSGELTAISTENHKPAWGQTIIGGGLNPGGMQFNTISGEVIISNRNVYASVPSGLTIALEGVSGKTLWKQEIGSAKTMLSAGNYLYMIDTNATLYALDKANGGIIWKRQLEQYQDVDEKTGNIEWTSPLMSNGNIVIFSNIGKALIINAKNGKIIHNNSDAPETIIDPAIADGKLYLHAKDGYVYIYSQ
jgi:outer membrane protein assembly factor BamB